MPTPPLFGVCGFPVGQSLSPRLHTWALEKAGHSGTYTAWEVPATELPMFIDRVRRETIRGVSLTIPHKETVIPLLDGLTETARRIGAVNTLFWQDGRLLGHNTDMEGFLAPLRAHLHTAGIPAASLSALVLGAGGAARAAVAGLIQIGVAHIHITARNRENATRLADSMTALAADWTPQTGTRPAISVVTDWDTRLARHASAPSATPLLVVNTTPLGMYGKAEDATPYPFACAPDQDAPDQDTPGQQAAAVRIAYDLVYNPLQTRFLREAHNAGWRCVTGLDMFVAQAAAQLRLWTDIEMDTEGAQALLRDALHDGRQP